MHFSASDPKTYKCGTLSYTTRGLVLLFGGKLRGDFCFTLMQTVAPGIVPLKFGEFRLTRDN